MYPTEGDFDVRQARIGAYLSPGYTGSLELDGVEVPEEDLHRVAALYQVELAPPKGSDLAQLKPGRHCATIRFWPIGQSPQGARSEQWCFNLH